MIQIKNNSNINNKYKIMKLNNKGILKNINNFITNQIRMR